MRVVLRGCAWLLLLLPMLPEGQSPDSDCVGTSIFEYPVERSSCQTKVNIKSTTVTLTNEPTCTRGFSEKLPFLAEGCFLELCEEPREEIKVSVEFDQTVNSALDELHLRLLMKIGEKTFELEIDDDSCLNCTRNCSDEIFFAVKPQEPIRFVRPPFGSTTAFPTNSPSASVRPSASPTPLPTTISPTSNEGSESLVFAAAGGVLGILAILILLVVVRRTKKKEREIKQNTLDMVIPPRKGKHLTMSTLPSVTSAPKLNSTQLNYVRFSTSTQNSRLSHLLKNEFSNRNSVALRLSAASAISSLTVSTYKSKMTNEMMERSRKFKALSSRLSSNYSRINELLGMAHVSKSVKKPTWTKSPRELVKQVCDRLQGDILSAADVEKLDSVDPLPKFSGEAPPVDLEFYLFRLINALNSWFDPDGNNEMVGMRSLMFSIIYLRKIKQTVPLFGLTEFNVHRIFAILLLVAAKFTEDELISNAFWGDACGLPMEEVNKLEEEFCFSSEFNFFVTPQELDDMATEFNLNIPRESVNRIDVASKASF